MFVFCFGAGPAEDCTERAGPLDSKHARADQHKSDNAILQQPHDVLPDQHQVSAGHKPKTHGRGVQPRRTVTVRELKRKRAPRAHGFVLFYFTAQIEFPQ